ncbi:hypothetical protein GCM10027030_24540 [Luteococcus sediminum]
MNKLFTTISRLVDAYPQAVLGDVAARNPELFLTSRDLFNDLSR